MGSAVALLPGCAIHYFDKETGTEHLWGFGHMKMRSVPFSQERVAVVKASEMLGLNIGAGEDAFYLGAGWDFRTRLFIVDTNASISFIWPTNTLHFFGRDFFRVRVGTNFPGMIEAPAETNQTPASP